MADLVACTTSSRINGDTFDRSPDLTYVLLGLVGIPTLLCEVPDLRQVTPRRRSEPIGLHCFFDATNASKSKGSAAPDASPSSSAARSAVNWVS